MDLKIALWGVAAWVSSSFPVIRIILISMLLVISLGLIVSVLFQASTSTGMGAIGGQTTETFYSKNKGRSLQGLLKRLTVILAISLLVVTVLYLISVQIYPADMTA